MEAIYEELDEAKVEIEKLKAECRIKGELSESLKRTNNEQLIKIREASSEVEKLTRELYAKEDEISSMKQFSEDLKSNLKEKEAIIQQLSSANDKLRGRCDEKVQRYEEENKLLALALEEANEKCTDQEKQICSLKGEIEGLKELVPVLQTKFSEVEKTAKISKELRQRDDLLQSLEEESRKFEEQLKWKTEQFNHLEEAHDKLRHQFKEKEREWEKERNELLDEISKLQENLDSQIRISEGLQNRLQMCNQALAHEESKRKYLEVQLSESKTCFDNVLAEYEEAKSRIESLTSQRDNEIASLRGSLGTKETLYKEMEYQLRRLELEKQELVLSLKEFQEARIQEAGASSSLSKLRNKLRALEKVHGECSTNLKAKEAEWRSQSEKLMEDLDCSKSEIESKNISIEELKKKMEQVHREYATILEDNEAKWCSQLESLKQDLGVCRSELESQNSTVRELKREVEACDSLILQLELQNEETSLMFLVLSSEFTEAQQKLVDARVDKDVKDKENKESLSLLSKQLELKNTALMKAQKVIEEERKKVVYLSRKLESLNFLEEQQLPLQKELARQKDLLSESHMSQIQLEEQLLSMKQDLSKVREALDRANEELAEKFCQANEAEFELQIWKSIAEQLKASLEENRKMRREVEASLLEEAEIELHLKQEKKNLVHIIEERDKTIGGLQEQLNIMKEMLTKNAEIVCPLEPQRITEKSVSEELQDEVECWEQDRLAKDRGGAISVQVDAERNHKQDKERFHHLVQEKDQRVDDLQQLVRSLEQEFESSTGSFATRLSEMQVEINLFREAWEKITLVEVLKEIEIQENNLMISELERDLGDFQEKMEQLKKSLLNSEVRREELEADLEAKQLHVKSLTCKLEDISELERDLGDFQEKMEQLKRSLLNSEVKREELEAELEAKQLEVKSLTCKLEDILNLSSERENLLCNIDRLCDRISMLSGEDVQLMETLASIVQTLDHNRLEIDLKKKDEFFDPIKENKDLHSSPLTNKFITILDERSPLRSLNN